MKTCTHCNGTGAVDGYRCLTCGGLGHQIPITPEERASNAPKPRPRRSRSRVAGMTLEQRRAFAPAGYSCRDDAQALADMDAIAAGEATEANGWHVGPADEVAF